MSGARKLSFERTVFWGALFSGLPALITACYFVQREPRPARDLVSFALILFGPWLLTAFALRARSVRSLQTVAHLIEAIRNGDFSMRGRGAGSTDAFSEVLAETNRLSDLLREKHLTNLEATALVQTVIEQVDVALFAFDGKGVLRLINRAGVRFLGKEQPLLGKHAADLGLQHFLELPSPARLDETLKAGGGTWELRRTSFRERGLPHQLVVVADLRLALRQEERSAWQALIRVLSHEINNSLAPIQSIAQSQKQLLARVPPPVDRDTDLQAGLSVIERRAEGLGRLMTAYAQLARLPVPRLGRLSVRALVERVAQLETRQKVEILAGPELEFMGDGDQLEQLLINLVRNAGDAAFESAGSVTLSWAAANQALQILVEDTGPGLLDRTNLFVPFFTTKTGGSGIGLVLSRQIAEAHGGTLSLDNRVGQVGSVATLRLPL